MTTSNISNTDQSDQVSAAAAFADPVAFLAAHGVEATLVEAWAVPTAA
jgi:hypothetical protein